MKISENIVPLSPEEIETLQKDKRNTLIAVPIVGIVFVIVLYFIFDENILWFYTVSGSILLLFSFFMWKTTQKIRKDIQEGMKRVIVGTIDNKSAQKSATTNNKSSTNTNYYLWLGEEKFSINSDTYYKCEKEQKVEIHITPHSQHIYKIIV